MTAPCKNCERRTVHPNCHANCQEYKEFVEQRNKYNSQKLEHIRLLDYIAEKNRKVKK